jgi:hypothetical protein
MRASKSTGLRISPDLALPTEVATETLGILAKKGAGKSNAAVVLAEELHDAGVPWVAVDPKGDWWGVRSSADGTSAGLPVVVFGGKHGDVPLEPTAGALIADLVLGDDDRGYLSCVLDVSQFTISDQRRFLLDFGERLFRRKDEDRVLHVHAQHPEHKRGTRNGNKDGLGPRFAEARPPHRGVRPFPTDTWPGKP